MRNHEVNANVLKALIHRAASLENFGLKILAINKEREKKE